jgi:hypothetical protein
LAFRGIQLKQLRIAKCAASAFCIIKSYPCGRMKDRFDLLFEKRNAHRVLVGNLKERDHLENLVVNGRIILK